MARSLLAVIGTFMALAACTPTTPPGTPGYNMAGYSMADIARMDIPDVTAGEISLATMKDVTRELSSDAYEGRAPGTPGEDKTLAYLVKQFTAAGLKPGNKGSWFQDVPLMEITGSNYEPLKIWGTGRGLTLSHGTGWVGVSYREDNRIELADSELVFVGYGINAPEKGWNDYRGLDMHGKTAVILINDPDYQSAELTGTFNGRAMTYYGRWTYKFEEAARQGAAAALIVHDTYPASYGWNVVETGWTGPQAYAQSGDDAGKPTLVNGWLSNDAAQALFGQAGLNLAELTEAAAQPGFKALSLGLTVSTGFDNAVRRHSSKNIIGLLPGADRPDEYVLHSAHWDHLGRCTANPAGDDICNGAIDNATGIAALITLAQTHAKAGPPSRSLVFLAVTAEESGLLGSEYYGRNPVFPLHKTVGGLNIDALFLAGPARDVTVVGGAKSQLDAFLAKALWAEGRSATPDASPQAGYYYRSDHFSFAKRGVPMLYVDGGLDLVTGGRAAGEAYDADYRDNKYHSPDDEYDPAWNWSGVAQDLQIYYRLGRSMAGSTLWPNWLPGDEFRRIRDESCKEDGGC